MNFNFDGIFGVKTKAKLDQSEVNEKPVEQAAQQPVQQRPIVLSVDVILNKLLEGVDETSIHKYRTGMVKMEDIFQTEVEKRKENIAATANSVFGLFQKSNDDDITAHDKESFTKYCDNFKALVKEEKDYLVTNLTDEIKNQMSKGETLLIEELISNYSHRTEMDAMNPFAF